jgi:hypothetical protein
MESRRLLSFAGSPGGEQAGQEWRAVESELSASAASIVRTDTGNGDAGAAELQQSESDVGAVANPVASAASLEDHAAVAAGSPGGELVAGGSEGGAAVAIAAVAPVNVLARSPAIVVPTVSSRAGASSVVDLSTADDSSGSASASNMVSGASGTDAAADDLASPSSAELAVSSGPSATAPGTAQTASLPATSGGTPAGSPAPVAGPVTPVAAAGAPARAQGAGESAAAGSVVSPVLDPQSASWQAANMAFARVHSAISEAGNTGLPDRPAAEVEGLAAGDGEGAQESPPPSHADLATSFLPFDRASVERAIDEFLDHFESLGTGLPDLGMPARVVPGAIAVAAVGLAAHRVLKNRRRDDDGPTGVDAGASLLKLSSLSVLWGCGE